MAKITKRTVDALTPVEGRHVLLWDDELPGFGIRCLTSGAKIYFLKYRNKGGRQRWLSLGMHGPITPEKARAAALTKKAEVINGGDPAGELKKKSTKTQSPRSPTAILRSMLLRTTSRRPRAKCGESSRLKSSRSLVRSKSLI